MKKILLTILSLMTAIFVIGSVSPILGSGVSTTHTESDMLTDIGTPFDIDAAVPTPAPSQLPEPTVYPATKTIEVEELKDYTVVYPAEYTDFRMDIVEELIAVINKVTGADINMASDAVAVDGKKIILASAVTEHSFKKEIEDFDDRMDYIVAVDGDNIVLGGKNYYSDMRAVYNFLENNLGYTSYNNSYSGTTNALSGVNFTYYEAPEFILDAATWATLFDEEAHVKDVHDANFNQLMTHYYMYDELNSHNFAKWCAKYDLQILFNTNTSSEIKMSHIYWDCPMIYGAYIWDEPAPLQDITIQVTQLCKDFEERYKDYGWHAFINFGGRPHEGWIDNPMMRDLEAVCFDWYIFVNYSAYYGEWGNVEGRQFLYALQNYVNMVKPYGQKTWAYIQSYKRNPGFFNPSKAYRWQMYMDLCFDVDGIMYFEYANEGEPAEAISWMDKTSLVVGEDFSKGDNYYYAQKANEEILKVYDILKEYDYVGAYTYNTRTIQLVGDYAYARFNENNSGSFITDIIVNKTYEGYDQTLLVGNYEKGFRGNEKAMILMDLEMVNDTVFGEDEPNYAKVKLEGNNPKFYFEGELVDVEMDADGYYLIDMANANCWIITVE